MLILSIVAKINTNLVKMIIWHVYLELIRCNSFFLHPLSKAKIKFNKQKNAGNRKPTDKFTVPNKISNKITCTMRLCNRAALQQRQERCFSSIRDISKLKVTLYARHTCILAVNKDLNHAIVLIDDAQVKSKRPVNVNFESFFNAFLIIKRSILRAAMIYRCFLERDNVIKSHQVLIKLTVYPFV